MIPLVISLIIVWVVMLSSGSVAIRLLALASGGNLRNATVNHEDRVVMGLILQVTVASIISLFGAVGSVWALIVMLAIAALGARDTIEFLRSNRRSSPDWILSVVAICWFAIMVFIAAGQTNHFDTGLYHAQMVKWNRDFGAVPGLANLHWRLGFNSAWDVFGAVVDRGYLIGRSFHLVNLFIGIVFLMMSLRGVQQWLQGNRSIGTILRALGLVVLLYDNREVLSSLSTDWPSTLLVYYAVVVTIDLIEQMTRKPEPQKDFLYQRLGILTAICCFAVTVKLSSIPILLLLLTGFRLRLGAVRVIRVSALVGFVVLGPFVARNIVLSGCLVYPVPATDVLPVSWKVPHADVVLRKTLLNCWGISPSLDWDRTLDMSLTEQFRTWYHLRYEEIARIIPWICLGLAAWLAVNLVADRKAAGFQLRNLVCAMIAIGILFWFWTVREPRYATGWILSFALIPLAWFIEAIVGDKLRPNGWRMAGHLTVIIATLWLVRHAGLKRFFHAPGPTLLALDHLPEARLHPVTSEHGLQVNTILDDNRAWDAPLPSTPEFNPAIGLRGKSLAEGFVVTKPYLLELAKEYPRLQRL